MHIEYNKGTPKIRILEHLYGNAAGDIVKIRLIDDVGVYYYDDFNRWCFLYREEEGELWEWVKRPREL